VGRVGPAVVAVHKGGVLEEMIGEEMVVMVMVRSHGRWQLI
jgi:hypothetical protein